MILRLLLLGNLLREIPLLLMDLFPGFIKQRQKDSFYQKITNDEKSFYTIRSYYVEHEGNLSGKT